MKDYRDLLLEKFQGIKSNNRRYSLRSFSRLLGVSVTSLSIVLRKERHLSVSNFKKVAEKLEWGSDYIDSECAKLITLIHRGTDRKADSNQGKIAFKAFASLSEKQGYELLVMIENYLQVVQNNEGEKYFVEFKIKKIAPQIKVR